MVDMKQNIIANKKNHMPAEICSSNQVLFFTEEKLTLLVNITGTSVALTVELDARTESLVDTTHEQSLKVFIRQPVPFSTKSIFTNPKKSFTCCTGWDTSVELHKQFGQFGYRFEGILWGLI